MHGFDLGTLSRRTILGTGCALVGASTAGIASAHAQASAAAAPEPPVVFSDAPRPAIRKGPLSIGSLIYPGLDQIDFTGPFEVFARIPNGKVDIVSKTIAPVHDVKGLALTPTMAIADAPLFDVLHVAGGLGQQNFMDDAEIMSLIRRHADAGKLLFSVCTGALLCGAAGVLKGRQATTHWAAHDLLSYYGAKPVNARVVVDGNYVSAAGVTSGLDGALVVVSLLRGEKTAEEIQLDIEYAPDPIFHSGTPEQASSDVVAAFFQVYGRNKASREAEAKRFAEKLGVRNPRG